MSTLAEIETRIHAGRRLTLAEGEHLFAPEANLHAIGQLADIVRQRLNGTAAYYIVNAHVNPTNVCLLRCPLCAFSCDAGDLRAYELGVEEILSQAAAAAKAGCTELHLVGGLHPEKTFAWHRDLLAAIHAAQPRLHLKAWTAVEIDHFARGENRPVDSILEELISVGLGSLPGGGAEIFAPRVRKLICPRKIDADAWLAVHRAAHRLHLPTNATMLYGHVETPAERIDHLDRLRRLQDETGGFQAFVPLKFHPRNTALKHLRPAAALDDLRVMAVSRLMLDNIPHLKAYWISLGVGTAQVALAYGADDLDGTVRRERIHHDAGATSPEALDEAQLRRLIIEAGREPVERDSLYKSVPGEQTFLSVRKVP